MNQITRTFCVVSVAACCCSASNAQGTGNATASPQSFETRPQTSDTPSKDEANVSPRERGRILVKRNPIASEYQVFGDMGSSPGADADAEGVDYRSYFPRSSPTELSRDSLSYGYSINYNNQSGGAKGGADLKFSKILGLEERWAVSGQARSNSSDRRIEHYESVWQDGIVDGSENLYFLDRPRFSYDEIFTRNNTVALQIGHTLNDRNTLYFKSYYQDYFDNMYRNRLELQLASGDLVPDSIGEIENDSVRSATFTDSNTRRYFGDTSNTRTRQHNTIGGTYTGDIWTVDYSIYSQKWNLDTHWYNWNFNDFGLDISYDTSNPYTPTFEIGNNVDLLDSSNSRFSNLRIHDSFTRDRDLAARIDGQTKLKLGDRNYWIQTGLIRRSKERDSGESRDVYLVDPTNQFYLSDVEFTTPGTILDGQYAQQAGLDPQKSRRFFENNPNYFSYNEFRSDTESAPQSYQAEEIVSSGYLLGTSTVGKMTYEIGGRIEYTETATRGTVVIPESVNDPNEGVFIREITNPSDESINIVKNLYSNNDYTNFIPTFEASFKINEESKLRASWFQQLMRPQYFNIVDYRRISVPTRGISEGNPNLEPTSIDKFRFAWSNDSKALGDFSIEAYYINIEKFFYGAVSTENILEDGAPVLYRVGRVENGDSGSIKGFEVQWKKSSKDLPLIDQGTLSFAYTFSDSEATVSTRPGETLRVPERSDHLFNLMFSAKVGNLSSDLSISYQSEALDDVGTSAGQDLYREDVISTNLNTQYTFDDGFSVYLNLANLSDHPERSYEGDPIRVKQNQYSSWYAIFGFRNSF